MFLFGGPDLPHKMAAQFCGGPELLDACVSRFFHPTKWLRNFAGAPIFLPQELTLFVLGGPELRH